MSLVHSQCTLATPITRKKKSLFRNVSALGTKTQYVRIETEHKMYLYVGPFVVKFTITCLLIRQIINF